MVQVAFFAGAIGALAGAIGVIALRNPFYSVLALVVHLVALAGLFLLLYAQFVAAAQVVVYAGAVMVLYVFVAAYVGAVEEPIWEPIPGQRFLAPLLAVALFVELSIAILGTAASAIDSRGADRAGRLRLSRGDRHPAPGALPDRLRGRLDAAPGGCCGRHRAGGPNAFGPSTRPRARNGVIGGYHLVPRPLRAALRDRRRRGADPAQPPGDPALSRADAERGEPRPGGLRPPARRSRTARCSR